MKTVTSLKIGFLAMALSAAIFSSSSYAADQSEKQKAEATEQDYDEALLDKALENWKAEGESHRRNLAYEHVRWRLLTSVTGHADDRSVAATVLNLRADNGRTFVETVFVYPELPKFDQAGQIVGIPLFNQNTWYTQQTPRSMTFHVGDDQIESKTTATAAFDRLLGSGWGIDSELWSHLTWGSYPESSVKRTGSPTSKEDPLTFNNGTLEIKYLEWDVASVDGEAYLAPRVYEIKRIETGDSVRVEMFDFVAFRLNEEPPHAAWPYPEQAPASDTGRGLEKSQQGKGQ